METIHKIAIFFLAALVKGRFPTYTNAAIQTYLQMHAIDINGDGIPEIWGESPDLTLNVFDRYAERQIW